MVGLVFLFAAALLQTPAQRASALVDAGVELANRGRFNEAGEKFVQALAIDPQFGEAHYLLGLVRHQDGRSDDALASFRTALRINPRYTQAQARVCELESVIAHARESGYDAALASCRRASALDPKDPEPRFHLGKIKSTLGDYAGAIGEYNAVLKLDPKFARVRFELAVTYLDAQELARAVPLLREIVSTEPAARFYLGSALSKQGDCVGAVSYLEAATESAQKYYLLASCLKRLNRSSEAAVALARVREFRESADARKQARYLAAMAHRKAQGGELKEAIEAYRAALELAPDPTLAVDLAVALLKDGQPGEVVTLLAAPSDPLARYQVALAYSKLGRLAEAQSALEAAVRDRPTFAEAWYQLGLGALQLREYDAAERALRTATQLRPDEKQIRLAWAEALELIGNAAEAARQRQLAGKMAGISPAVR